jgi:tyrosine-specific transport protein
MSKSKGSSFGGMLLIAGSCIGAGMLGLPIQTGLSGLLPSILAFLIVWAFMTLSGFYLLEVNSWHPSKANLLTMISHSLGKNGRYICWIFYLFLFYALLVAYMAASGNILSHFLSSYLAIKIAPYIATIFFVSLFALLIFQGTKVVDHSNRFLMIFKIGSFVFLLILGASYIKPDQLAFVDTHKLSSSIPILITAFGFHNMIPSLNSYMQGDTKKVRKSIIGGSLLSLFIYLLWQTLVLGIIPVEGSDGLKSALVQGKEASELISEYLAKPIIGITAQILGFFAILTSFLAQSLSLSHFLQDGLKLKKTMNSQIGVVLLTLAPPLVLAILYPSLFYKALNFAGGVCTVVLFGIIPGLMIWKGRYKQNLKSKFGQVPGGKLLVTGAITFSACIFIYEILILLGNFF